MKDSDHRIVLAKMNIDWHKKTPGVIKTHHINREKLRDMEIRKKYEYATEEKLKATEEEEDEQEQWNRMVRACQEASEVLGYVERKKRKRISNDEDIRKLSEEHKDMQHTQKKGEQE